MGGFGGTEIKTKPSPNLAEVGFGAELGNESNTRTKIQISVRKCNGLDEFLCILSSVSL